jgi:NADPH:quinone reductase-like Zn-dependent oxidoreductase
MAFHHYGPPEVLGQESVERPVPHSSEVLVRVAAVGASIGDHHAITGRPYLIRLTPFGGIPGPRNPVPGTALSGWVEQLGPHVTGFEVGDEVFGQARAGAFAEYVVVPVNSLAHKPRNLSLLESAAVPWAQTALQGLRDAGRLRAGQKVLINGASGAVGGWAVQLAAAMGAVVTGVCSTRNLARVHALGARHVIDYTREDFTRLPTRYDLVFDVIGNHTLWALVGVLEARGTYVACADRGGDWLGPIPRLLSMGVRSIFSRRRLTTFVATARAADLVTLKSLIEAGKVRPTIEHTLPLAQAAQALHRVGEGHGQGQTLLTVAA